MGHATWSIGVFTALEYFTKNRPISHKIMLSAQVSVRKQLVIIIGNNQKIALLLKTHTLNEQGWGRCIT